MADFYKLLGLTSKSPTEEELKKAYKKAALKHHPDRNPKDRDAAEKRFQRVAEAYEVLSDPQKKHIYDQYGEEGLKQGPPPPQGAHFSGGNPFGGQGNPFGGGGQSFVFTTSGGPSGMGGMGGGVDAYNLFAQLFGGQGGDGMSFQMDGGDPMAGFGGLGGLGGFPGMARQRRSANSPCNKPDVVTHNLSCTLEELYKGSSRNLKVTRELMDAQSGRMVKAQKVLHVDVGKGWKEGTKVTFKGEGDERPGKPAQDIVFVVKQKAHSYLERKGNDLHFNAAITVAQAEKGVKVTVPTLDGRKVQVQQAPGIKDRQSACVKGEGMPCKAGGHGDLVVNFRVAASPA